MTKALVLGKFLPLHKGHEYLIDYAIKNSDKLYIIVDNIYDEIIPLDTRMNWIKELYPNAIVLTQERSLPQNPNETNDFWEQWEYELKKILPENIDIVFASETYGEKLAQVLNAKFKMVDFERKKVNISATKIRNNVFENWEFISNVAKSYFVKKVCIFGPESTGKSTLTKKLAEYFNTTYVEEYARNVIEKKNGNIDYCDMLKIVNGHNNAIKNKLSNANKLLFVDTDAITSKIWSLKLFNKYPKEIEDIINKTNYDLYLLLDVDVPWIKDVVRYFPDNRKDFFDICKSELENYNKKYIIINGNFEERFQKAVLAIKENINVW